MQIINLYRYEREVGKITVSTEKPEGKPYTEKYRLIADEGMILTNGEIQATCIDVESTDGWSEIVDSTIEDNADNEDYAEAGKILLGVSE